MTLKKTFFTTLAATGMAVASLAAVPAVAQDTEAPAAPADVEDGELDAFVAALDSVMEIEENYAARLGEAEGDEAQQQQLMEEARAEMVAAVNETPEMDVERYVEILELAQNDPDLSAELSERMEN
ncbi:MAG: DUF4168 domain-containing protein [Salibaculum sp.]|jgi:hypothetical protein|uniref:DUF4168 domain-containing protein n=1 Tax=Roseovarius halophilus (ex Wu et al. 2025) TaxID=3376060 RepID=UPI00286FCB63|nr:DUF4168 domain-containing protein [Salibaculum sp.]MDR9427476.1 DUF4168 domain-containing protein [Salibaculum sp.]MDR9482701.1 DUF4168 domain-containing protein [Salibaculum sp.]